MDVKVIDKVAWIYILDKKVLSTRSKCKQKFYFPGGKREKEETDIECLKREILEELNVHILDDSVRFFGKFEAQADNQETGVLVQMLCYFADYSGSLKPSNEIELFEFINFDDRDKTSRVDQLILQKLVDCNVIE